jgi:hypothetical protein
MIVQRELTGGHRHGAGSSECSLRVLYEVANESSGGGSIDPEFAELLEGGATAWGDSTEWQYWVIRLVKPY